MAKPTKEEVAVALKMAAQMRDKNIDPFFSLSQKPCLTITIG